MIEQNNITMLFTSRSRNDPFGHILDQKLANRQSKKISADSNKNQKMVAFEKYLLHISVSVKCGLFVSFKNKPLVQIMFEY